MAKLSSRDVTFADAIDYMTRPPLVTPNPSCGGDYDAPDEVDPEPPRRPKWPVFTACFAVAAVLAGVLGAAHGNAPASFCTGVLLGWISWSIAHIMTEGY
jgi:hypothetical protein